MQTLRVFPLLYFIACGGAETLVPNRAPEAFAGFDQSVAIGDTVHLDGSDSFDPDGNGLTYNWAIQGPTPDGVTLSPQTGAQVTLRSEAGFTGTIVVALTVDDGAAESHPDWVGIHILEPSALVRPSADAGPNRHLRAGQPLVLDAAASRGLIDHYAWTHLNAPDGELRSITRGRTALLADLPLGLHVFGLSVAHGARWSAMDCISVWVDTIDRSDAFPSIAVERQNSDTVVLTADTPADLTWSLISDPDGNSHTLDQARGDNNSLLEYRSVSSGLHLFAAALENGLADWVALDMESIP